MEFTLTNLIEGFHKAIEDNFELIAVAVVKDDLSPELIINPRENFEDKLAYYEKAYNEDLTLKANPNIRITGIVASDSLAGIQKAIVGGKEL